MKDNESYSFHSSYSSGNFQENLEELGSSGFYYNNISRVEAEEMLFGSDPGTFLIRDSSSDDSLFAVTFVTRYMTVKNVRILYTMGNFQFQSNFQKPLCSDTVLGLIEKQISRQRDRRTTILLLNPLKQEVQSLKHICRLNVNRQENYLMKCKNVHVRQYLFSYPYKL